MTSLKMSAKRPTANGIEKSLKDLQEDTTRFNVDIPKSVHRRLKLLSVDREEDMTVIVRRWISEKLDEAEKEQA